MPVRAQMRGSRVLALGMGMKDVGTLRSFERAWICWSFWRGLVYMEVMKEEETYF